MTRAEALRDAAAKLREAGIDSPRLEARLLLAHALGIDQESLLADWQAAIQPGSYQRLVQRRCGREPLAFVLGKREFWSLPFEVSAATLIPRPDSETLIGVALSCFSDRAGVRRILDLGTGTGCLLIAALTEFRSAFGVGVDISPRAASLAARNAVRLGVDSRCGFIVGDWTTALVGRFDLILCNPPYIRSAAIPALMPEVAGHEPKTALDGGVDGLDAYRRVVPSLPGLLAPGGAAILEIGAEEQPHVTGLAQATGLPISVADDLAGVPRTVTLRGSVT